MNNTTWFWVECGDQTAQDITALVLTTVGIVGNAAFLYVIISLREMHTTTNIYLANLAIADLIFLVLNGIQPFCYVIGTEICAPLLLNIEFHCISNFIASTGFFAGMIIVGVIAIERYCAICYPLHGNGCLYWMRKISWILQALCWLLAILPSITPLLPCYGKDSTYTQMAQTMVLIPMFFTLTILVFVLYIRMAVTLRKSARNNVLNSPAAWETERQVMRICLITAVLYIIFMFPYILRLIEEFLILYFSYFAAFSTYPCFRNVAIYFLMVNASINPVVYNVASSRYRIAFKTAFRCN
ncbi:neuropeptides capa receptor-like [Saccoglossus kowalevskii]|uniref:Neuropeptides capa receptor-like n=1 Tax=Saccoglossus kowalevskii TaxID=10224 RepID=A0ABM0N0C7_SACKO|nr:PREDICTED: neuropeptides capa receptor-like [Saccoglossus kowalevskii]